jgi:ATP-dependent RNA helicase DOB1
MGKSKKRDRELRKHGMLALNGSGTADAEPDPDEPRKIAKLAQEAPVAQAERAGVNLVEVDGKSCTHEVAWPPPPEDADPAVPSGAHVLAVS